MNMGRVRVVVPGSERIEISDGDWIEIKRELNTGDSKRLEMAGVKPPVLVGERIITPIDWGLYEIERATIFLAGWSLVDAAGDRLKINVETIQSLDTDTFGEINTAILELVKQRSEEKKSRGRTEPPKKTGDESASEQTSA